jgi:hypothetical protein
MGIVEGFSHVSSPRRDEKINETAIVKGHQKILYASANNEFQHTIVK